MHITFDFGNLIIKWLNDNDVCLTDLEEAKDIIIEAVDWAVWDYEEMLRRDLDE